MIFQVSKYVVTFLFHKYETTTKVRIKLEISIIL